MTNTSLYIGLMSGTSLDGVDGVLVDFSTEQPKTISFAHQAFDVPTLAELKALQSPCENELHRAMLMSNAVATAYAKIVSELLMRAQLNTKDIAAIGAHGQTIRHQPALGYTVQLLNAALLAELTSIAVVSDFRSRDIAAGGQGAPLVPAFHAARFAVPSLTQVVCNIGGIANITLLQSSGDVRGFDTGPGNCLMDGWAEKHLGTPYDANGDFAAKGHVHASLLADLLSEPYFKLAPPKSTGRDLFNAAWLAEKLTKYQSEKLNATDVQATLTELTAQSIASDISSYAPQARQLWLCGGGAYNAELVKRMANHLPLCEIGSTKELGVPVMQVESLAFAWLARQHLLKQAGNLPAVTGSAHARILGQYTPH